MKKEVEVKTFLDGFFISPLRPFIQFGPLVRAASSISAAAVSISAAARCKNQYRLFFPFHSITIRVVIERDFFRKYLKYALYNNRETAVVMGKVFSVLFQLKITLLDKRNSTNNTYTKKKKEEKCVTILFYFFVSWNNSFNLDFGKEILCWCGGFILCRPYIPTFIVQSTFSAPNLNKLI